MGHEDMQQQKSDDVYRKQNVREKLPQNNDTSLIHCNAKPEFTISNKSIQMKAKTIKTTWDRVGIHVYF